MKRKYLILLVLSVSFLTYSLLKTEPWNNNSIDQDINQLHLKNTQVVILNKEIRLGKLDKDDQASAVFELINVGKEDLRVEHVEVSCSCTSGEIPELPTAPGDTLRLVVSYDKSKPGYFFQDVLFYGNFEISPLVVSFDGTIL